MQEGTILRNRYRLEQLLGRGGMAEVYLTFDLRRQVHVAAKVLREDLAEDPEFVRRFEREASALARLEHPNIVRFYAFEREGPLAFIIMDYVPGTTLRRRLVEVGGPLPLDEASKVVGQVGAALQYAHHEGYIHRDIKPGNIMLRSDGTLLLSDFGIARVAEGATATMGAIGTPAYMSPEQILGREVDPRTDTYSLGIVLYETVTGRRPFLGETGTGSTTIERIRDEHLHRAPPDLRRFNRDISPGVADVIMRCLAKRPEDRWPDLVSLIRAWGEATRSTATVSSTAFPTPGSATAIATKLPSPSARAGRNQARPPARALPVALIGVIAVVTLFAVALLVVGLSGLRGAAVRERDRITATPGRVAPMDVVSSPTTLPQAIVAPLTPTLSPAPPSQTRLLLSPTALPTATPVPPTPVPTQTPAPPPTYTLLPSATPIPPSLTPVPPTATRPVPSATPIPPRPTNTSAPAAPPVVSYPAPVLLRPDNNAAATGSVTFAWSWNGPALAAGQGFEVRVWREGQADHFGAAEPVQTTSTTFDVGSAYGVIQGGSGTYFWTVALVNRDPYQRIGPEASPRALTITVSSSRPAPTLAPP